MYVPEGHEWGKFNKCNWVQVEYLNTYKEAVAEEDLESYEEHDLTKVCIVG